MSQDKEVAISIRDVHKEFVLPQHKNTTIKQTAVNIVKKNNKLTQKVLDGVTFDIHKGEFFGIVGKNGSGKSTLLKILAGIYSPDSGDVQVKGRLTPFIELGVGFSPDLSGRDNVYLNAALLGFTRKETDTMYDEIVEFAELEEHMDKKLKNYSSGMQVRLAFSIAVKAKSDILVFDEVLAVGDEAFQQKSMDIFREYRRTKQTVVLVTHSMESVRSLCTRALMLEDGKITARGSVDKVADAYQKSNQTEFETENQVAKPNWGQNVEVSIEKNQYLPGDPIRMAISWNGDRQVKKVAVSILDINDIDLFGCNTGKMKIDSSSINLSISLNLSPGRYYLAAATFDAEDKITNYVKHSVDFVINDDNNDDVGGLTRQNYHFSHD